MMGEESENDVNLNVSLINGMEWNKFE